MGDLFGVSGLIGREAVYDPTFSSLPFSSTSPATKVRRIDSVAMPADVGMFRNANVISAGMTMTSVFGEEKRTAAYFVRQWATANYHNELSERTPLFIIHDDRVMSRRGGVCEETILTLAQINEVLRDAWNEFNERAKKLFEFNADGTPAIDEQSGLVEMRRVINDDIPGETLSRIGTVEMFRRIVSASEAEILDNAELYDHVFVNRSTRWMSLTFASGIARRIDFLGILQNFGGQVHAADRPSGSRLINALIGGPGELVDIFGDSSPGSPLHFLLTRRIENGTTQRLAEPMIVPIAGSIPAHKRVIRDYSNKSLIRAPSWEIGTILTASRNSVISKDSRDVLCGIRTTGTYPGRLSRLAFEAVGRTKAVINVNLNVGRARIWGT